MDCARHGGERRLGHAAPLREAVVRKAGPLLLDGRRKLQTLRRKRSRRATAQRPLRIVRNAVARVARTAGLWRRNGAMAAAAASNKRRHDRLFPRSRNRHAFQRHAHHRNGLRRRRPRPCA